ncbi:MAG TPA: OsmC family peroxiredoxin [Gaiellaceae bacterium]
MTDTTAAQSNAPEPHAVDRQMLATRLRQLRLARGLRLRDVTALAGVSQPYLSRIESGQRWPSLLTLLTLARAYGVEPAELLARPAAADLHVFHRGSATWVGGERGGAGRMTDGAFAIDYDHTARLTSTGERDSTHAAHGSPEELLGMALAGCYSMSLAEQIESAGFVPGQISTAAEVQLDAGADRVDITHVRLTCSVDVPGMQASRLDEIATLTARTCVVSRALAAVDVTVNSQIHDAGAPTKRSKARGG